MRVCAAVATSTAKAVGRRWAFEARRRRSVPMPLRDPSCLIKGRESSSYG
jgi:hypothetical protein